jgi:hypothetical protein
MVSPIQGQSGLCIVKHIFKETSHERRTSRLDCSDYLVLSRGSEAMDFEIWKDVAIEHDGKVITGSYLRVGSDDNGENERRQKQISNNGRQSARAHREIADARIGGNDRLAGDVWK